jgi:hypothetical protein
LVGRRQESPQAIAARLLDAARSNEILSVERTRSGFRIHSRNCVPAAIRVEKGARRGVEAELRAAGMVIVDEWGARIDASQFEKEADPAFRKLRTDDDLPSALWALVPNWYLGWRHRRLVRQSSDDA